MKPAGIVGYGRFGQTLARLAAQAKLEVRAWDVVGNTVPQELRVASLEELAAQCELVWLAVPVPGLLGTLRALKPFLGPRHVVADVCSVKVEPARALARELGTQVPWVATHPLFGPASAGPGDRRRAVVCPSGDHPAAVERVRQWLTAIGCEVLELDPEAHDRLLARTQALAFFAGQGLAKAGLGADEPLTRSSESVRELAQAAAAEAPHLLDTVLSTNPYAAAVREGLLEQLEALDARAALNEEIPKEPEQVLAAARERIDRLDRRLLIVLRRRADLMRQVSRAKQELARPVRDAAREAAVLDTRRQWADELGLDRGFVESIFQAILEFSRSLQQPRG